MGGLCLANSFLSDFYILLTWQNPLRLSGILSWSARNTSLVFSNGLYNYNGS